MFYNKNDLEMVKYVRMQTFIEVNKYFKWVRDDSKGYNFKEFCSVVDLIYFFIDLA